MHALSTLPPLVIAVGEQGARAVDFMAGLKFSGPIYVCDTSSTRVDAVIAKHGGRVQRVEEDIAQMNDSARVEFLKRFGCVVDALPARFSWPILHSAAQTGRPTVSVSFLEQDFMKLDHLAREHGSLIVPDCGAAPGFSHHLAGCAHRMLGDNAKRVVMKLGALPVKPVSPFFHTITWSPADLVEEYIRQAMIRRDGKIVPIDPFAEIQEENLFGIPLQSFLTDGLRSWLTNYPDADAEERTLRHPGHLDFMAALRAAGFLSAAPVEFGAVKVPRRHELVAAVLKEKFGNLPREDMFVMEIAVGDGLREPKRRMSHQYKLGYDVRDGVYALTNSVAITAVTALRLILEGEIKETGVKPLELLTGENIYRALVDAHRKIGAEVELEIT